MNHAELGGEIALIWKFPDEILKAIAFHHRPDLLADSDAVPWIVYLANQVCHVMGIGVGTDALAYRAVGDVAGRFQLKQRDLENMMAELHLKLQGARELVSIVFGTRPNRERLNGGNHGLQPAHRRRFEFDAVRREEDRGPVGNGRPTSSSRRTTAARPSRSWAATGWTR